MSKRTFIAADIEVSKDFLIFFSELKEQFKSCNIKWVNANQIHLTIKFIGETAEDKVDDVAAAVDRSLIKVNPFCLQLRKLGYFGKKFAPKVFWVGVERNNMLLNAYKELEAALGNIGISKSIREYHPHITLGRVRSINNQINFLSIIDKYSSQINEDIHIAAINYYESILTPKGPKYNKLYVFSLKG